MKDQNWFAVYLDFFIVVAGILIAFQITNWNEAQQDKARGEVYAERLTEELKTEYEFAQSRSEYYATMRDAGNKTYLGLTQSGKVDNETILINAFRASQYVWYERRRATYDEVIAAGALNLIKDDSLRETAIGTYSIEILADIESEGLNSPYRAIFRETIEPALHDELLSKCGDKYLGDIGLSIGLVTLDYDCTINSSDVEMEAAVRALQEAPGVLKALKLRNAQISGRLIGLENNIDVLGLRALYEKGIVR